MGTILDYVSVYSNTNAIRTASRSVSLPASATEIKGQSDAMKKLQEDYETLKRAVSQYSTTLQMDLMAIDLLVDSQVQKDKNQSELFKQGTGIFDTCLTP